MVYNTLGVADKKAARQGAMIYSISLQYLIDKPGVWKTHYQLFPPVLSLLFYIAHQSFSLDCLIKTSPLLKNAYVCYQPPAV